MSEYSASEDAALAAWNARLAAEALANFESQEAATRSSVTQTRPLRIIYQSNTFDYTPDDATVRFEHMTDTGNAIRMTALYGERIGYFVKERAWYIWTGHAWRRDNTLQIMRIAKATVERMFADSDSLPQSSLSEITRYYDRHTWCLKSESNARLNAMVRIAGSLRPIDSLDTRSSRNTQ